MWEHAHPGLHLTFIDRQVTLCSILCPLPITACKEIHRTIWRLELLIQCEDSILAKCPVHENRGVLRNVYCTSKGYGCVYLCESIYAKVSLNHEA